MLEKPISPLRQRMIDDLTARRFKEKVQKDYVRQVRTFAAFLGRSPDTATSEDLRRFQLHMTQQQISAGSISAAVAALRFFFNVTLERPDLVRPLTTVNKPRRAPVVLSQEEVARLLEAAPGLKVKAALSVACGAGLRVSEVVALKVSDIDSQRMTLWVERGKGQRAFHPFVRTGRGVAALSRLPILPPKWEYVCATSEKATKQRNLCGRRRGRGDGGSRRPVRR
jgi:integrase/recombinase XerD